MMQGSAEGGEGNFHDSMGNGGVSMADTTPLGAASLATDKEPMFPPPHGNRGHLVPPAGGSALSSSGAGGAIPPSPAGGVRKSRSRKKYVHAVGLCRFLCGGSM